MIKTVHIDYKNKNANEIDEVEMIAFAQPKDRAQAVAAAKRSIGQRFGSVMFHSNGENKGWFSKGATVLGWFEFNRPE